MTQSIEQERAEFEAWFRPEYLCSDFDFEIDAQGDYIHAHTAFAFAGYQQASRRAPVVPQGWKTPVDAHAATPPPPEDYAGLMRAAGFCLSELGAEEANRLQIHAERFVRLIDLAKDPTA